MLTREEITALLDTVGVCWPTGSKRRAAKLLLERPRRVGSTLRLPSGVEFESALRMSVLVLESLPLSLRCLGDTALVNLLDHHVD